MIPDNHMTDREDLPTQSELSLKLEKASQRVKLVQDLFGYVENSAIDAKSLGLDATPYYEFLGHLDNQLKVADALFDAAFMEFTTGRLNSIRGV